uniref:Uncharacterized protein n=1 Tax=Arundo donax TaxID=35708 RepID=A0A0A9C3M2_ARUDO
MGGFTNARGTRGFTFAALGGGAPAAAAADEAEQASGSPTSTR